MSSRVSSAPRSTEARIAANPYDPWTPVAPDRLAGRGDVLACLETALEEGRSVSLLGDWRVGKSSVLGAWAAEARRRGREVRFVSGEQAAGVSVAALVAAVTGLDVPGGDTDAAAAVLDRWTSTTGAAGLAPLLLVDEADELFRRFDPVFFVRLRGMLGRIQVVLASRHPIDEIHEGLGRTSPLRNRLQVQWLGLLDAPAAERLIGWGEGLLGPGDADGMREWAGRHPFYLQLLGRHLVDARRHGEPTSAAIDRFMLEADARLGELWAVLREKERAQLRECLAGVAPKGLVGRNLRSRGLVTDEGRPFGEVLAEWLRDRG